MSVLILGMTTSLAYAPFFALPFLWTGLSGLLLFVMTARNGKRALWEGWFWGFGYFLTSNYWIGSSFLVEADRFAWMIPFMVGGLAAYLAIFTALASGATFLMRARASWVCWLFFGLSWIGAEWLRAHLFTGYPWNLLAYVWGFSPYTMQLAAYAGPYGLSFVTALLAAAPLLFLFNRRSSALTAMLLLLGIIILPALRISELSPSDIEVRLVQPGFSQTERVQGGKEYEHLSQLLRLSASKPYSGKLKAIIWPEAATDFLLERHPDIRAAIASVVPLDGYVLSGVVRADPVEGKIDRLWNSMAAIDEEGNIRANYDKFHLVPLGEYVPGRRLLPFIDKLTPGQLDFSAGEGPATLNLPGLSPFSTLICYEIIFPGAVVQQKHRPLWLLNLTNDGWFGKTVGPYQHLISARFRAVEEGLPLIRVANTGISAIIDPHGRILASLPLGEVGTIDAPIPAALTPTPYSRYLSFLLSL